MKHIDWSKAPDWAEGHALVAHHGITEVWVSPEQYTVVGDEDRAYSYGGGTGDHRHNFTRGQIQYITPRPDRWDGTGLPPVGFDCEYLDCGEWVPCQVVAHRHAAAVVLTEDVTPALANQNELRLHRTHEQIAEAAKQEAIAQLIADTGGRLGPSGAATLYSLGYRRQAAP